MSNKNCGNVINLSEVKNMSLAQQNMVKQQVNEELLYKVILKNDLSGLTQIEQVQHVKNLCLSLGLNPLTKPIQLLSFEGKLIPYVTKDGGEQLRNIHNVSIVKLETEMLDGSLYVVRAYATKPNGRHDCSTSVQSIINLKGKAIENSMKKCETQAKRRVTLSICGLGFLDESEIESIPGAKKIDIEQPKNDVLVREVITIEEESDISEYIECINNCTTIDELRTSYNEIQSSARGLNKNITQKIINAKNEKLNELKSLETKQFISEYDNHDPKTGEIS